MWWSSHISNAAVSKMPELWPAFFHERMTYMMLVHDYRQEMNHLAHQSAELGYSVSRTCGFHKIVHWVLYLLRHLFTNLYRKQSLFCIRQEVHRLSDWFLSEVVPSLIVFEAWRAVALVWSLCTTDFQVSKTLGDGVIFDLPPIVLRDSSLEGSGAHIYDLVHWNTCLHP